MTDQFPETEFVHSELVYSFFRLLLDPVKMETKKLAKVLEECIDNIRREKGFEKLENVKGNCNINYISIKF